MNSDNELERQPPDSGRLRIGGLRRFAISITVLNLLGHTLFGFEQSFAQPIVALLTAYGLEFLVEIVSATSAKRPYKFSGGIVRFIDFLLPGHITALAVSMLLYVNDNLIVVAFATSVAVGSKAIFRVRIGKSARHFYNPSNFGITVTLLLFSWVGIAPPYQFSENLDLIGDWLLPLLIILSGSMLNGLFTKRLPLISAWLLGFVGQALIRSVFFETPFVAALMPMTGVAFVLYTFYMITDPATTPNDNAGQIGFGLANAIAYGILMISHIVFGLFFALTITCTMRGILLFGLARLDAFENQAACVSAAPAVEAILEEN
jgi:Na+-translocating ferredoxin:NAD+ oxidoreductase RnfD subunit